jgi:hypothetical protein
MFRARCAALALAAGLGVFCGCCWCGFPSCCRNNGEEYSAAGCCGGSGAVVAGELPYLNGGAAVVPAVPPGYVPSAPPPANGMPRLAPVPQAQAPMVPYAPQSGIKDNRPGELELVH